MLGRPPECFHSKTRIGDQIGLGALYQAVSTNHVGDAGARLVHFVEGAPVRSGEIPDFSAPTSATLGALPGPFATADQQRALFVNASDRFVELGRAWKPVRLLGYNPNVEIPLPTDAMKVAETNTLREASARLTAGSVAHDWDRPTATIRIRPDPTTALGQYAELLEALGTKLVYSPAMLWNQACAAMLNAGGHLFLSNEAITALAPGASEAHETIHAVLRHLVHDLGRGHPFVAQLLPVHGTTMFGSGDDYTNGFSMEELLTTVCDMEHDAAADRGAVDRHARIWDRGRMPRAVVDVTSRIVDTLDGVVPTFETRPSTYYVDSTQLVRTDDGFDVHPQRNVLAADVPPLTIELSSYHLSGAANRRTAVALVVDHTSGRQLEIPLLDADPDDLSSSLIAKYVVPYAQELRAIAKTQADAYESLSSNPADEAARDALRSTLDLVT